MGTFTTSKQFALGLNLTNQWWLSGASIDLDFDNGRYYDASLTALKQSLASVTDYLSISRASSGYAKTSAGTLTNFANNVLRLTDSGLLIEDARTNLMDHSEAVGSWTFLSSGNVSIADNATTAPNAANTATRITENSSAGSHNFSNTIMGLTDATAYTFSAFAKANGRTKINIDMSDGVTGDANKAVDLSTGVVSAGDLGAGGWTNVSATVESFTNNWSRVCLTGTVNRGSPPDLLARIWICDASGNRTYTGDGSSGIYVWGVQLEQAAFASSYIPTISTSVTRAADAVTIGGNLQTVLAASAGSLFAQIDGLASGFAANAVDSNGTNLLGFNSGNNALASLAASLATSNTANRSSRDKLAIGWSGAGRSLVLNGGTVATDANAQTPSSTLRLGVASSGANNIYGYIARIAAWNSKQADVTLQSMTTLP